MKKWLFLLLMTGVMAAIFSLSAQPGAQSYQLSAQFAQQIQQESLASAAPGWFSADFHANLRKWAHVCLYFLLGVTAALTVCAFRLVRTHPDGLAFLQGGALALGTCLLYAISDELHQHFVPGRACLPTDILVDAIGFVPGVLLVCGVWYFLRRRVSHRELSH